MPKVETRGRPRLKTNPTLSSSLRRAYRALEGKPTVQKRKDIEFVLWHYRKKLKQRKRPSLKHAQAIENWTSTLKAFDVRFYKHKAEARLRSLKMSSNNYVDDLLAVLYAMAQGQDISGFKTIRTVKTERHKLYAPILSGEELNKPELLPFDMSLCIVRKQSRG